MTVEQKEENNVSR